MRFPHRHTPVRASCPRPARALGSLLCLLVLAGGVIFDGPPAAAGTSSWQWPLPDQPAVLNDFAPPAEPWGSGHRGIDLAATPGQPVHAAADGKVRYAGLLAGRGVVSIVHGERRTTYEPVVSSVHVGDTVDAGDRIGVVGQAHHHCAAPACLHWGLLRGDDYLDPRSVLGRGPVRLLPVWKAPPPQGMTLTPAREEAGLPRPGRSVGK